jgi:UDP-N-acetylmuramoyl-tripeptide--D-alanyl-D-alanine ligase
VNLSDVIAALTDHKAAQLDIHIGSAVIDSRQAIEGSLFIALPGERVDGHDYVQAAFDNGAQVALIDHKVETENHILDVREGKFNPDQMTVSLPLCLLVEDTLLALQKLASYWRKRHPLRTIGITGSVGKTSTKELVAALLSQKF